MHPWQLALFPDQAQQDVWAADPDTLVSSSYAPTGRLTAVDGRLRGDRPVVVLLRGPRTAAGCCSARSSSARTVVPSTSSRSCCLARTTRSRTSGTRSACGARAATTSSWTRSFVPAHRTLSFNDVSALRCPGQAENTAPLYRLPFGTVFSYTITTPLLGIATGAYDAHVLRMRERVRISYGGQQVASDPHAHVRVARAASDIDASWLQLERNLDEQMRYAAAGEEIPMELRLRARRDQVMGTERAVEAVSLLFKNSGGHSLRRGNPIERAWRDAGAASVHAANDTERWLALYGKGAFGLPTEEAMV